MLNLSKQYSRLTQILLFVILVLAVCLSIHLFITFLDHEYLEQHFVYLAKAFTEGGLHLGKTDYIHDTAVYNGNTFVYYGPLPAIIAIPFVNFSLAFVDFPRFCSVQWFVVYRVVCWTLI